MVTGYEVRVGLVAETLRAHLSLDEASARDAAVHVLHALSSIPEKVR